MAHPTVDVVIAVHRRDRPVGRAVASVLDGSGPGVRVVVVGHGLPVDDVRALLPERTHERTTVLRHDDGIAGCGGPFNAGLDASEATYVGVMGSDDHLEQGAVDAWRALAGHHGSDAVLARVVLSTGPLLRTPPVRPLGRPGRDLDLARDRLAYRTAPLGLLRTATLRRHGLRLTEGLTTGEDLAFSTRLWSVGRHLRYAARCPAYVVGVHEGERLTTTNRSVLDELAAVHHLLEEPWFAELPAAHRLAVGVKLVRIHLFGIAVNRAAEADWVPAERRALADGARAVVTAVPQARAHLSLAETRLLTATLDPDVPDAELAAASRARRRHGTPRTVVTTDPRRVLAPQSPLRLMVASAAMR